MPNLLSFSDRLTVVPVVHGSGDFAVAVRDLLLRGDYDCLAVPLPGSFQNEVLDAVDYLPAISAVVQHEAGDGRVSYVPIDPCQPVIAALRFAKGEGLAIEFIDLETIQFEPTYAAFPDPYALKQVPLETFAAALLTAIPRPPADSQADQRVRRMAFELHRLEVEHSRVLAIVGLMEWPWLREAYVERRPYPEQPRFFAPTRIHSVKPATLTFLLGELPFITALYERSRATLDSDENLTIDGVKELLLEARDRWSVARQARLSAHATTLAASADWLSPQLLQTFLQYVRNLSLLDHRFTPDLYTLVVAAKQLGGDSFAFKLLETARDYFIEAPPPPAEEMAMGIGRADLPGLGVVEAVNRLPGHACIWRTCELVPEPPAADKQRYKMQWNPYQQCSYPPEDVKIESFRTHVMDQARALIGADLARTEKFTCSIKDGLDLRETLRHWHTGDLYVKEIPPSRGTVDVLVFLFDNNADPEHYTWRSTWYAEHGEESTLAFYATDFKNDPVGPGICRSIYGGTLFVYPPRWIPDIWNDPRLPRYGRLDDRLIHAACLHAIERHIAVVSAGRPTAAWRAAAKKYGKHLIHLPLSRFSGRTIDRLRVMHVLNGKDVRSYASRFIVGE